ncbi:MAG: tetratricopeptide repeat protein [Halobacteriota archaeon]
MRSRSSDMARYRILGLRRKWDQSIEQDTGTNYIELADERFRQGKFREAVLYYDRALQRTPESFRALHNKGLALFALNKFDLSIECYDRALALQPDALSVKLKKAISLNCKCDFEKARELLSDIVSQDSMNKEAFNARALAEFHLGLDDEGMADLQQALAIDSNYTMAWNNLGSFYLGLRKLDDAIACFDRTLAIDAHNYDALLLKDMALERKEKRPNYA